MGLGVGALVDAGAPLGRAARRRRLLRLRRPRAAGHHGDDGRRPGVDLAGDGGLHVGARYRAMAATPLGPATWPAGWRCGRPPAPPSPPAAWPWCWRSSTRPARGACCRRCRSPCSPAWPSPCRSPPGPRRARPARPSFPAIQRFVIIPMFLFAGVFYPVTSSPAGCSRSPGHAAVARRGAVPGRGARHPRAADALVARHRAGRLRRPPATSPAGDVRPEAGPMSAVTRRSCAGAAAGLPPGCSPPAGRSG